MCGCGRQRPGHEGVRRRRSIDRRSPLIPPLSWLSSPPTRTVPLASRANALSVPVRDRSPASRRSCPRRASPRRSPCPARSRADRGRRRRPGRRPGCGIRCAPRLASTSRSTHVWPPSLERTQARMAVGRRVHRQVDDHRIAARDLDADDVRAGGRRVERRRAEGRAAVGRLRTPTAGRCRRCRHRPAPRRRATRSALVRSTKKSLATSVESAPPARCQRARPVVRERQPRHPGESA